MIENILISSLPFIPLYVGVYIVFLMRSEFDLTLAGTYGVASGLTATMISHGQSPFLAILASVVVAAALSLVTFGMYAVLRIPVFLGGLIMATALYTVALRVMDKQPSISLLGAKTLFDRGPFAAIPNGNWRMILPLALICLVAMTLVWLLLKTDIGLAIRVSGRNAQMARANGFDDRWGTLVALAMASGLAGLSGSVAVQAQRFAAVSLNADVLIAGLGGIVVGAMILRPTNSRPVRILATVLVGAFIYQAVIVIALDLGLDPVDVDLVNGLTLVAAIALQLVIRRIVARMRDRAHTDFELFDTRTTTQIARELTGQGS